MELVGSDLCGFNVEELALDVIYPDPKEWGPCSDEVEEGNKASTRPIMSQWLSMSCWALSLTTSTSGWERLESVLGGSKYSMIWKIWSWTSGSTKVKLLLRGCQLGPCFKTRESRTSVTEQRTFATVGGEPAPLECVASRYYQYGA